MGTKRKAKRKPDRQAAMRSLLRIQREQIKQLGRLSAHVLEVHGDVKLLLAGRAVTWRDAHTGVRHLGSYEEFRAANGLKPNGPSGELRP